MFMNIQTLISTMAAVGMISTAVAAEPSSVVSPAAAGGGEQVGVGKRDGVTISGNEAFITRNGTMEKLVRELSLPSGVTIRPDGTMILPDKTDATLRSTQLLTLEGKVVDLPLDPNVNPTLPAGAGAAQNNGSGAANPGNAGASMPPGSQPGNAAGGRIINNGAGGGNNYAGGGLGIGPFATTPRRFVDKAGKEFMATIGQDGGIVTTDGQSVVNDGSVREVTNDRNGGPVYSPLGRNGTVMRSDRTMMSPDGTIRSADGKVVGQNGQPFPGNGAPGEFQGNSASDFNLPDKNRSGSRSAPGNIGTTNVGERGTGKNSPNNVGTLNTSPSEGGAANNTGTLNNPAAGRGAVAPAPATTGSGMNGQGLQNQPANNSGSGNAPNGGNNTPPNGGQGNAGGDTGGGRNR